MQDVRIRICAGAILSCSAFLSLYGAAAALLWWLIFTPRLKSIVRIRSFLGIIFMIAIIAIILQIMHGSGVSYFGRMTVIILIGMWLAAEYKPGEFLHFGTWLFGKNIGFELGLIAEMAMQSFVTLRVDLDHIRMALHVKGIPVTIKTIIPTGNLLIHRELFRAKDNADLLAVRGYQYGGTLTPVFFTCKRDIVAGLCAMFVMIIALFPFVNFLYFDIEVLRGLL